MSRTRIQFYGIVILFMGMVFNAGAQTAFVSAGSHMSNENGSVSASIGQIFYTQAGDTEYVIEGVQQPYEISLITGIKDPSFSDWAPDVFPNPVQDLLSLELNCDDWSEVSAQLINTNGQVLLDLHVGDMLTGINMSVYEPGLYYLSLQKSNGEKRMFKIIKN